MSLESILNRITKENDVKVEGVVKEASQQAQEIIREAEKQAQALYKDGIAREKSLCEFDKQRLIANAQLESRKKILQAKQELIGEVIAQLKPLIKKEKFRKKQIHFDTVKETAEDIDFYLNKLRQDYEAEIAKILFE
ncbi:MAG: V-type ATP synthase subunit E family protein [Candidatus Omnitrophica bacterium]|nr:V-type ATP synthase subunit E family protein [Candidatus Omnitrophota bacterium]